MSRLTVKAPLGLIHLKNNMEMTINEAIKKLSDYEDLEEQGKLIRLPCKVGDTIYVIPSEVNYRLNILSGHEECNRIYKQNVDRIEMYRSGYLLVTCGGMQCVVEEFYKKTWFLTQEEAEAALKQLERSKENEID